MGFTVTSLVWSLNSRKLYSASDKLARVFKSKSGEVLHRFQHDHALFAVALSPTQNILACVGTDGIVQLWDTKSHQPLGLPLHEDHTDLFCVSFSRDGRYLVYGGDYGKLTLWTVKDIIPQLPAPTLRNTQQETWSNSLPSSCLDADTTGGDGFIEKARDDTFFQSSQEYIPSQSPGFYVPSLSSAHPLWNVIFPRRSPQDESIPQERSKRGFFSPRVRSKSSLELSTMKLDQQVPEGKVGAIALSPPSSTVKIIGHSWNDYCSPEGKKLTHSSARPVNALQPILHRLWHWNSSLFRRRSSGRPVDVAASRDEGKCAITLEYDAQAAPAMLCTDDNVADSPTRSGQFSLGPQVPQGRQTQTQTLTSGPEEIGVSCCGFFFGHGHSN
jgi:WD40 repeat protein